MVGKQWIIPFSSIASCLFLDLGAAFLPSLPQPSGEYKFEFEFEFVHHRVVHHLVDDQPTHPGINEKGRKLVRTDIVIVHTDIVIVHAPEIQRE